MNTNTDAPARYSCKTCGAESPTGLGYAVNTNTVLPAPAATCEGYHFGDVIR